MRPWDRIHLMLRSSWETWGEIQRLVGKPEPRAATVEQTALEDVGGEAELGEQPGEELGPGRGTSSKTEYRPRSLGVECE